MRLTIEFDWIYLVKHLLGIANQQHNYLSSRPLAIIMTINNHILSPFFSRYLQSHNISTGLTGATFDLSNVIWIIFSVVVQFFACLLQDLKSRRNMIIYCIFISLLYSISDWAEMKHGYWKRNTHKIDKHEKLTDTPFLGYRLHSTLCALQHELISLQGKRSINFNELFQMRWNQVLAIY